MNTVPSLEDEKNHEFARQVNRQVRSDPNSPYAGKFLGIAEGRVVVVAESFDEADAELDRLGFGRDNCLMIEASADYDTPLLFWNARNVQPAKGSGA